MLSRENAQRLNLIDVIKLRDAGYREYIDKIREFYDNKYENWTLAHAGHSKWAVASHVNDLLSKSINRIQNFHHLISSGKAAPIAGTSIDLVKARERISKYGGYCVVSFLDAQELVKCENTTKLMTEYHVSCTIRERWDFVP